MDGIQHLYKCFGILEQLEDAPDKAGQYVEEYQSIVNGVKGSNGEKNLAASFIPRFFKYFPDEHLNALNSLLDLCEDEDAAIRRLAIKALPVLCDDSKEHLTKIADVLTQLLQTGDMVELSIVDSALRKLIKMDPKGSILGVFSQILVGDEETREHAIDFLKRSVVDLIPTTFHPNPDAETALAEEIQKAMSDVTGEEFKAFVEILSNLKVLSNEHQQLVDLITEQAELDNELQSSDSDVLEKFITCCRLAIQFFQKGADAERFFQYIVEKAFPVVDEISVTEETGNLKLEIFKVLAEICTYKISDELINSALETIFDKLLAIDFCGVKWLWEHLISCVGSPNDNIPNIPMFLSAEFVEGAEYMPLPVVNDEKDDEEKTEPQLEFSYVECLIYTFHQLGRKFPEFLTADDAAEKLRDFKLRLQYVGQRCQMYIKQLKMALNDNTASSLKDDENKMKVIALRTTSNIHVLIKDLFHSPPSYNNHVVFSWNPTKTSPTDGKSTSATKLDSPLDEKRKRAGITPITFQSKAPAGKNVPEKKQKTEYYLAPGRRSGAGNGTVEGKTMPIKYRRGGRGRGFRGRRGTRGRGWRW